MTKPIIGPIRARRDFDRRLAILRQFFPEPWFISSGIIGEMVVAAPREIIKLYPHRRPKK